MKTKSIFLFLGLAALFLSGCSGGHPGDITNWLQNPATPLAHEVRHSFYFTLYLILPFLFIAEVLLIYVILRFRKKPGREPAKFHDNPKLEIAWTIAPAITLVFVAVSTYGLIGRINYSPESDMQVEVTAQRFLWKYHYPEYGITISEQPLVVPEDKVITLLGTSVDVIHSWWVPAFGIKRDLLPGRIVETWFKAVKGNYKGQCAELCGPLHAEMLIDVSVVSQEEFEQWVKQKLAEKNAPADSTNNLQTSGSAETK